jgi:plastocyanin
MRKKTVLFSILFATLIMIVSYVPVSSGETIVVHMKNDKFDPAQISIDIGDTVKWVNNENDIHQVTIHGVSSGISPDMDLDDEWSFTFNAEGTYNVRCIYHSPNFDTGMVMTVVVGSGTGGPTPPQQTPGFDILFLVVAIFAAIVVVAYLRMRNQGNH